MADNSFYLKLLRLCRKTDLPLSDAEEKERYDRFPYNKKVTSWMQFKGVKDKPNEPSEEA